MNYSKMRIAELKAIAEEKGLRNVDGMKKAELASLLENVDKCMELIKKKLNRRRVLLLRQKLLQRRRLKRRLQKRRLRKNQ